MKRTQIARMAGSAVVLLLFLLNGLACNGEEPTPAALAGFDSYISGVEARLIQQHRSADGFLERADEARVRNGELVIEKVMPVAAPELPGAMIHDWRGTAFLAGAHAGDFERMMRDYSGYPEYFSPEVLSANVLSHDGNEYKVMMRVRQKHILTVVLDTAYDVSFGRLDRHDGYSYSRSTAITEIEHAGEPNEVALTPAQNHGFLWRLNTYWSYQERDGGLYMQVESVSLTRAIPPGLGWAIGPFVESVPKESLEFTLRAVRDALRKSEAGEDPRIPTN